MPNIFDANTEAQPNIYEQAQAQLKADALRRERAGVDVNEYLGSPGATLFSTIGAMGGNFDPTFGPATASILDSAFNDSVPALITRQISRGGFTADPSFQLDQKRLDELSGGIDPELRAMFADAVSEDHALAIRSQALDITNSRRILSDAGWYGTALHIGAGFLDPAYLAAGLATGGIAELAAVGKGVQMARLARAGVIAERATVGLEGGGEATIQFLSRGRALVKGGVTAAAPLAGIEAYRLGQDPTSTARDYALGISSALAGGVAAEGLGGAGRFIRGIGTGVAQGGVYAAGDMLTRPDDVSGGDIYLASMLQFASGMAFGVMHGGSDTKINMEAEQAVKDAQFNAISKATFGQPENALTEKGRVYFKDQLNLNVIRDRVAPAVEPLATEAIRLQEDQVKAAGDSTISTSLGDLQTNYPKEPSIGEDVPQTSQVQAVQEAASEARGTAVPPSGEVGAEATLLSTEKRGETRVDLYRVQYGSGEAKMAVFARVDGTLVPNIHSAKGTFGTAGVRASFNKLAELYPDAKWIEGERVGSTGGEFGRKSRVIIRRKPTDASPSPAQPGEVGRPPAGAMGAASGSDIALQSKFEEQQANRTKAKLAIENPQWRLDLSGVNDARSSSVKQIDVGEFKVGVGRWDMPGMASQSEAPLTRLVSNMNGPDPLPKADGSKAVWSTKEWGDTTSNGLWNELSRNNSAIYNRYVNGEKAQGRKPLDRDSFFTRVAMIQRRARQGSLDIDTNKHMAEAASALDATIAKTHKIAEAHGTPGFIDRQHEPGYLPRVWDRAAIVEGVDNQNGYGYEFMLKLMEGSLAAESDGLTGNKLTAVAKAMLNLAGKKLEASEHMRSNILDPDLSNEFASLLEESAPGLSKQEIEDIIYKVRPRKDEAGKISFAKRRASMDETFSLKAPNGETVSIENFLVNNAETLARRYIDGVVRASATSEMLFRASSYTLKPINTVQGLYRAMAEEAEVMGLRNYDADFAKAQTLVKLAAGIPVHENSKAIRAVRTIGNVNVLRSLSGAGVGVQRLGDMVYAASDTGLRAMLKAVPYFGDLWDRARNGQMNNEMLRLVESLGLAVDREAHRPLPRMGTPGESQVFTGKIEDLSARVGRFAGDISGLNLAQRTNQALASIEFMNEMHQLAMSNKSPSASRLAGMTLTPDNWEAISKALRDPKATPVEAGITGTKVARFDFDKWDQQAASNFLQSVQKQTRRVIHTMTPSQEARWMLTPAGKLISQFRVFHFGQWTKAVLYEANMRDLRAARNVGTALAAAALTYISRTYMDSIGRPDRDKFLKDRLTYKNVLTSAWSRSAFAALLPELIDFAWHDAIGRQPIFAHGRTTGIERTMLLGNPTWDLAADLLQSTHALQAPFTQNYSFSKDDVRHLTNTLVPNIFGVRNIFMQMAKGLPEHSTVRP